MKIRNLNIGKTQKGFKVLIGSFSLLYIRIRTKVRLEIKFNNF